MVACILIVLFVSFLVYVFALLTAHCSCFNNAVFNVADVRLEKQSTMLFLPVLEHPRAIVFTVLKSIRGAMPTGVFISFFLLDQHPHLHLSLNKIKIVPRLTLGVHMHSHTARIAGRQSHPLTARTHARLRPLPHVRTLQLAGDCRASMP
jgi:hypothetical protein